MRLLRWFGFSFALAVGSGPLSAYEGQSYPVAKHGGGVFTSGPFDLEFVLLAPKGRYAVYFNDTSGEEYPASIVSDVSLSIQRTGQPAENLALRIDDRGKSWLANGSASDAQISAARVSYHFRGKAEQAEVPCSKVFHAELNTPPLVKAGTPAQLTFTVKDFFGRNTRAMQIVHEMPMHVMIVSADLADFYHVHPTLSDGNVFRVTHVFPHGGDYRLFADFTPVGGGNHIESFSVKAQGAGRAAIPLDPAAVWTGTAGSVRMTLASEKPLRAGEDIGLYMTLADAQTGAPVHDLQRYLGAWAHIAIISQDTRDFLHVHPMEEVPSNFAFFWYVMKRDLLHVHPMEPGAASPATLQTFAGFRRAGLYKMWVEVQRANGVLTVPFVLRVAAGAGQVTQIPQAPSGATLIKVSSAGYEPSRIAARAGRPLKLAFFRVDAQNCGRVVRFPDLGIERELPPGQIVAIEVTPRKSGPLAFSCGMNMMKGELLVQ
jgi:hypothetical protein